MKCFPSCCVTMLAAGDDFYKIGSDNMRGFFMKVKDYVRDMIFNQKWAIETDVDFYEYDQFWKHCPFL